MGSEDPLRNLYQDGEAMTASAMERLVGSQGFGGLLGQLAENAAAISKLQVDALDLLLRNLRLASRRDISRLAQQLTRTEDKLERLLQEIEELRDALEPEPHRAPENGHSEALRPSRR